MPITYKRPKASNKISNKADKTIRLMTPTRRQEGATGRWVRRLVLTSLSHKYSYRARRTSVRLDWLFRAACTQFP